MNKSKKKNFNRIISLVLAFLLVIEMIPTSSFAANEDYPDAYTILVSDENGNAIEGAAVSYTIKNGDEELDIIADKMTTDLNGYVVVTEMAEYEEEVNLNNVTISVTVEKEGYISVNEENILVEDIEGNYAVKMQTVNVNITANITGSGSVVIGENENEIEVNSEGVELERDSEMKLTITPDEGYGITSIRIKEEDVDFEDMLDENGVYSANRVFDADTIIEVEFTLSRFVVTVDGAENGTVEGVPNDGYVNYGSDVTLTIRANDGYKLKEVLVNEEDKEVNEEGELVLESITADVNINVTFVDGKAPELLLTPKRKPDEKTGYYTNDFEVNVDASDELSEIKSLVYSIYVDDEIYVDGENEIKDIAVIDNVIDIDAEKYNSDNVKLVVTATDAEDNLVTDELIFKINTAAPVITVSMKGETNEGAKEGFYRSMVATIEIEDRKSCFDKAAFEKSIVINDEVIGNANDSTEYFTIEWTEDENNSDIHIAMIKFNDNGTYKWSIGEYVNKAGLKNEGYNVSEGTEFVGEFTLDNEVPTATIKIDDSYKWNGLLGETQLTFRIWKNAEVVVNVDAEDNITDADNLNVLYYKSSDVSYKSPDCLDELYTKDEFTSEKVTVNANEMFVVYARVMDEAGNVLYLSTNGIITDFKAPVLNDTDTVDVAYDGYYNKDVCINVVVKDIIDVNTAFSGIASVTYKIVMDGNVGDAEEVTLFKYDPDSKNVDGATYDEATGLVSEFAKNIKVDSKKYNSEKLEVIVKATDNAENTSEELKIPLKINSTKPTIDINFGEDKAYTSDDDYGGYFGAGREATITITDRADTFVEGNVSINVNYTGESVESAYTVSQWEAIEDKKGEYKAVIKFYEEGKYEWSIGFENKAGSVAKVDSESDSPYKFVIDTKEPEGGVTIGETTWDKLLEVLTFGIYTNDSFSVEASVVDENPYIIEYYKSNDTKALCKEDLDALDANLFTIYEKSFVVDSEEIFLIYLKITDRAGNYTYVCSNGHIVDKKESEITITADKANDNNIYNGDVDVKINVTDGEPSSGIKTVTYKIIKDGNVGDAEEITLFKYDPDSKNVEGATYDEATGLVSEFEETITIDSELYNSCNVELVVSTEDNASTEDNETNKNSGKISLDIDITQPEIKISYDNNNVLNDRYFAANRTATIQIKERTEHFDVEEAINGIEITAKDSKGNNIAVDVADMFVKNENGEVWSTTEGDNPDDAIHTAQIKYATDANYEFEIEYTDKAGNENKEVVIDNLSVAPYVFTIDTVEPNGKLVIATAENRTEEWENILIDKLTFGIWSKSRIDISAITDDTTSSVASIEYYKTSDTTAKTEDELSKITAWAEFDSLSVKANEQFTVYLKIVDKAGNTRYISTDGMIVDDTAPREESIAPEVKVTQKQPVNGIYNGDVEVNIEVKDPTVGGTSSGLKKVSYRVLNMGVETQSGDLYMFNNVAPTQSELQPSYKGKITVDSELNNSNDVVIEVYAEDNALNSSSERVAIKIDITNPAINISYNNNTPDSEEYYMENRVATVVVTERNFNEDDVIVSITNTDGVVPVLSQWTKLAGSGNEDNTTYTATISYDADGDYTFDIDYTDIAGNKCDGEVFALGTANATEFTIDKTEPVLNVAYDNNAAENGKYFKADRIATITVVEHNFDVNRVIFTQNGPAPVWSSNGDVHTATITYATDGDYTFNVTMTDMAGNAIVGVDYGNSVAVNEFTLDKTIVKPTITGVEDGKAYKDELIPEISFSDVNYSEYSVELLKTNRVEKNKDVASEYIKNIVENGNGGSGKIDTFTITDDHVNDGIYILKVTMTDMAGNTAEETVKFTVNRGGSVYDYDEALLKLIDEKYKQKLSEDIVITEYNADRLTDCKVDITRDGVLLQLNEGEDWVVSPAISESVEVTDGGWYEYNYTFKNSVFAEDGKYIITITSTDATGNTTKQSVKENKDIEFIVDTKVPDILIAGLEEQVIDNTQVEVTYTVSDVNGLKSVEVYVDNKLVGEKIVNFDGNKYEGSFILKESNEKQHVNIKVTDVAGNVIETDNVEIDGFNSDVLVSTNFFVQWYANKALFFGSIGGAIVAIAAIVILIVFGKKKKGEEE